MITVYGATHNESARMFHTRSVREWLYGFDHPVLEFINLFDSAVYRDLRLSHVFITV
eukprot:TRINITY_DN5198_c0_g1_i1.p3 TRINITY_DN5198_c0_g1~~TRINITY_DN5198_c0_g1_i1.p3  ORF type:complete len:57 (+),score=2.75 TRINITY_DN5198_c0_g1_i1:585-755(+)